jgi:hypothetical protein
MFMTVTHPAIQPIGPDAVAVPGAPRIHDLTPRALHARLLDNAAARRRRAIERRQARRSEDAAYWLHAAPVAVRKAHDIRCGSSFTPLP